MNVNWDDHAYNGTDDDNYDICHDEDHDKHQILSITTFTRQQFQVKAFKIRFVRKYTPWYWSTKCNLLSCCFIITNKD